ncbi:uroporphyrinogen-III C-methyltransferase [Microbacterium invictum]|uniref:uroporphyrinogen-III C-methyltransferase n=1 Tax=Microbacterium invictum TaxID=515415 RepID=A0AA40VLT6_9MICO|nr:MULTISPECIES: uroporphyrinogen-III C-methyltransferase [Microbacterium]MBB4138949.1 uroporphyrin-III C-methyltransferase/precorrin-2 dehydrogenase/sirohydrochlorin ferrochelatase [Microbacterium invictum]
MTTIMGLELSGRLAVLVGGGDVAGRRLRRLLEGGAQVRLVAPDLAEGTAELAAHHHVEWVRDRFRPAHLEGAWLAHTATGDRTADAAVVAACDAARIWCVNAGSGAHGSARFTAETRSDDVQIGVVSASGVDPRRSGRLRDAIAARLREGTLPVRRVREGAGSVHLVGGGPGPEDLITVRGRRLIAEADVIVHDRLGPTGVLTELEPGVEVIDVGKAPGRHTMTQEQIGRVLVDRARAGARVVRLKGGDPFVYGRGGEEVAACLKAGVPIEVVPGISSVIAVPQAAGIPVTHRGVAGAVHVVNGQDEVTAATVSALNDAATTVIVIMGVSAIGRFTAAALKSGTDPRRPVAFIENGHSPAQRTIRTTLGEAADDAARHALRNPSVIVIGEVARADLLLPVSDLALERA